MRLTLSVTRFDPQTDAEPYRRGYPIDWERQETVLDLLMKARVQDPSLSYRRSCRSGICGSCVMRIGDRSRLACQTLVREVKRFQLSAGLVPDGIVGPITIMPLSRASDTGDPVLHDGKGSF